MTTPAHRSAVFAFADEVVSRDAAADPILATHLGVKGFDHLLGDFSRDRTLADVALVREHLSGLATLRADDDIDRVAI